MKGKEKPSAAKLVTEIQKKHFNGRGGLPQMIDAIAEANGGKGDHYHMANASLDIFLAAIKEMKTGKK